MKASITTLFVMSLCIPTESPADSGQNLIAAMSAELARNQARLKIDDFDAPYFIGYRVVDEHKIHMSAAFGALVHDSESRRRRAFVDVRVGDYSFDSSPDPDLGLDLDYDQFRPSAQIPLDEDQAAIQGTLWLLTDSAYKKALSMYLQKKAKAVNSVKKKHVDSFSKEIATQSLTEPLTPKIDRSDWKTMVKRMSLRFRKSEFLLSGSVSFGFIHLKTFVVNSEGTRVAKERGLYQMVLDAVTRAPDGMLLEQGKTLYFRSPSEIPRQEVLDSYVDAVAKDLMDLRAAPMADPYTGPAILESEASGVFFHETIGHRLEGERQNDDSEGQTFKGQIGKKILPDFIQIVDDPTLRTLNNQTLNGHYTHDDEGVPARRTVLIEDGILKTFLTSRTPVEGVSKSNGHGRAQGTARPVARMGNLMVTSSKRVPRSRLKAMLIEEAKKQGKPYGLIITDIIGGSTNTSNYGYQAFKGTPRKVYRVDASTGHETLVRGVEMVGTPLSAINKIIATGEKYGAFNGYCGAESGYVPVSASAPAVLFREVELQRTKRAKRRNPILSAPWVGPAASSKK